MIICLTDNWLVKGFLCTILFFILVTVCSVRVMAVCVLLLILLSSEPFVKFLCKSEKGN